jgi:hypothetical protein
MGCGCNKNVVVAKKPEETVVQSTVVQSTLDTKATASLSDEVDKELDIPDPLVDENIQAIVQSNSGGFGI